MSDSSSSSARSLIPRAAEEFGRLVHGVPVDRWDAPTPCTDWSVRLLVNHLVSEHLWAPHLLRGETMDQVGTRYDGDVVGTDPVGAWDAAVAASLPAFAAVPSDETVVHLSFGEAPVGEYAEQMLTDLVVHSWDLARGADLEHRPARAAVEHALDYAGPRLVSSSGMPGLFEPAVATDSTDPLDRLVAGLGRTP